MLAVVVASSVVSLLPGLLALFVLAFWDVRVRGDRPVLALLVALLPAVVVAVIGGWVLWALGSGAAATVVALVPFGMLLHGRPGPTASRSSTLAGAGAFADEVLDR